MSRQNYFNIKRFWWLLRLEGFRSRKAFIMAFEIAFGMLFFFGFLFSLAIEQHIVVYDHHEGYAFVLLAGGFLLSSYAFHDLGKDLRRFSFLTLPVSALERFLAMWLMTSVGWVLLFTVAFALYSMITNHVGGLLFPGVIFESFEPLGRFSVLVIKYYLVLQGLFLVAATHFRGYVFPKALFSLILFAMVCGGLAFLVLSDATDVDSEVCLSQVESIHQMSVYWLWQLMVGLFWWALPPVCWVTAYLGLREQEA